MVNERLSGKPIYQAHRCFYVFFSARQIGSLDRASRTLRGPLTYSRAMVTTVGTSIAPTYQPRAACILPPRSVRVLRTVDRSGNNRLRIAVVVRRQRAQPAQCTHRTGTTMIRKLASGGYRLYSRKVDPKTGRRRNLGTFKSRAAAEKHERAVQYFKRH
jgi:hypothetical protein